VVLVGLVGVGAVVFGDMIGCVVFMFCCCFVLLVLCVLEILLYV